MKDVTSNIATYVCYCPECGKLTYQVSRDNEFKIVEAFCTECGFREDLAQ